MRFLPTTHALPVRLSTALTAYIATPASPVPAEVTPLPDGKALGEGGAGQLNAVGIRDHQRVAAITQRLQIGGLQDNAAVADGVILTLGQHGAAHLDLDLLGHILSGKGQILAAVLGVDALAVGRLDAGSLEGGERSSAAVLEHGLAAGGAEPVFDVACFRQRGILGVGVLQADMVSGILVAIRRLAQAALGRLHAGGRAAAVASAHDFVVVDHRVLIRHVDGAVVGKGLTLGHGQGSAGGNIQRHALRHGGIGGQGGVADHLAGLAVEEHAVGNAVIAGGKFLFAGGLDPAAGDGGGTSGKNSIEIIGRCSLDHAVPDRDVGGRVDCHIIATGLYSAVGDSYAGAAEDGRIMTLGLHRGAIADVDCAFSINAVAVCTLGSDLSTIADVNSVFTINTAAIYALGNDLAPRPL